MYASISFVHMVISFSLSSFCCEGWFFHRTFHSTKYKYMHRIHTHTHEHIPYQIHAYTEIYTYINTHVEIQQKRGRELFIFLLALLRIWTLPSMMMMMMTLVVVVLLLFCILFHSTFVYVFYYRRHTEWVWKSHNIIIYITDTPLTRSRVQFYRYRYTLFVIHICTIQPE